MSELINLQELVLVQNEELARLRKEVDILRKRQNYYCDNHCNLRADDGSLSCQFCDKLLCEYCLIWCTHCDLVACDECSINKTNEYSCDDCNFEHTKCNDCSTKAENLNSGHYFGNCKGQVRLVTK